ncbi:MAG TPA: beta-propeller fold lactonase family protein, partial [Patescibacteria group bacterium]|nr:beta-propeller fold lactonase family protein [Patescibacteria group bacterium]
MPASRRVGIALALNLFALSGLVFAQAARPARSAAIAVTPDGTRVWVVNPDSGSVTVLETAGDTVVAEIPVGAFPCTVAVSPDGTRVYVANSDSNDLSVIDTTALAELTRVPIGAQPTGVAASPDGTRLYVANTSQGRVTVLDAATLGVVAQIPTAPRPRGLAISADSTRLAVTHYLTPVPQLNATVSIVDTTTNAVLGTVALPVPPGLPGVANFLEQAVFRPGAPVVWLPMVQMETGNPNIQLTTTVHAAFAVIDVNLRQELAPLRTHLERVLSRPVSQPVAIDFSPNGAVALIANQASNDLAILNAGTRAQISLVDVGDAPQGVAVTPDGTKAYVSNYLGRSVSVVSVANPALAAVLRTVTVTPEPLAPGILNGKKLFFTSRGRMSTDNWIACISCHAGGASDGRDWNFTRVDEGIRNTTDIRGIHDSGAVHWTANMDELQDLEFNIRKLQFGAGLINGTPNDPFGASNAGLSQDLDDFAAFMDSILKPVRSNPNRAPAGGLTPQAAQGKTLFESAATGCASCHKGSSFNDSDRALLTRHDVGTLAPGDVNGQSGFDTPSLLHLFDTAPYLHDGSAPTLLDVLTTRNQADRHGVTSNLTPAQRQSLIAYMLQLDNDRDEMSAGAATGLPGTVRLPLFTRDISLTRINATDSMPGNRIWGFDLRLTFPPAGISAVTVEPAGPAAALGIASLNDPPADLVAGRKDYSVVFDAPIPLSINPPAPGDQIGFLVFTIEPGAAAGSIPIGFDGTRSGLRNDTGTKVERPADFNLLATGGSLTVGTPTVADGSSGTAGLLVSSSPGMLQLSWSPIDSSLQPATYNVYRGTLASLFGAGGYDHSCFASGLT